MYLLIGCHWTLGSGHFLATGRGRWIFCASGSKFFWSTPREGSTNFLVCWNLFGPPQIHQPHLLLKNDHSLKLPYNAIVHWPALEKMACIRFQDAGHCGLPSEKVFGNTVIGCRPWHKVPFIHSNVCNKIWTLVYHCT